MYSLRWLVLISIIFLGVAITIIGASASEPVVETPFGTVVGFQVNERVTGFFGIPYALPPVGENRWKSPQANYFHSIEAKSMGNYCIPTGGFPPIVGSEDCLYLNIYVPSASPFNPNQSLPVKVWIHGGAFTFGSGNDYNGTSLATLTNSIVVTMNYRLNFFGFYNDEALVQVENATLNFGLQDQQAAMRWIFESISAFGGNPDEILLFGESAGGASVFLHNIWSESFPFFSNSIAESPGPWKLIEYSALETNPSLIIGSCNVVDPVTRLTCLRSLNSSELLKALAGIEPGPIIDGTVIADQPIHILTNLTDAEFRLAKKALLVGTNTFEGNFFIWDFFNSTKPIPKIEYDALLHFSIPDDTEPNRTIARSILNSYDSVGEAEGYWHAMSDLFADQFLDCGANSWANSASSLGLPVFRYRFDHNSENWQFSPFNLNSTHMIELPYVWNSPILNTIFTEDEKQLSGDIITYFHSFHLYGDPNKANGDLPTWPNYAPDSVDSILSFETQRNYQPIAAFNRPQCASIWEEVLAQ